jgi:hypothetical protein
MFSVLVFVALASCRRFFERPGKREKSRKDALPASGQAGITQNLKYGGV